MSVAQSVADMVKETSTTEGTITLELVGVVPGFRGFVAVGFAGLLVYYGIRHCTANEWENGIGLVTDASPDTLSRLTVLSSSNAGALVNFSAGVKDVFCTLPAGHVLVKTHADPASDKNTGLVKQTHFEQVATINGTVDVETVVPDPGIDEAGLFEYTFTAELQGTASTHYTAWFKLNLRWDAGAPATSTIHVAIITNGAPSWSIVVGVVSNAMVLQITDDATAPHTINIIGNWDRIRHNESITP